MVAYPEPQKKKKVSRRNLERTNAQLNGDAQRLAVIARDLAIRLARISTWCEAEIKKLNLQICDAAMEKQMADLQELVVLCEPAKSLLSPPADPEPQDVIEEPPEERE